MWPTHDAVRQSVRERYVRYVRQSVCEGSSRRTFYVKFLQANH